MRRIFAPIISGIALFLPLSAEYRHRFENSITMQRLEYHYDKEHDEELASLAGYLDRLGASGREQINSRLEALKNGMMCGVCHFVFTKVNGERRSAYGTRLSSVIDRYTEPSKEKKSRQERAAAGTFPYFDVAKKDWRCFRVDRLVSVDAEYGE